MRRTGDLHAYRTPTFRALFDEDLPRLLHRLDDDPAPAALAEAIVAYSIVSEGVLSETDHRVYAAAMRHHGLMPGLLAGLAQVRRDEVTEFFEAFDVVPFGLTLQDTVTYAMSRFARRSARIERARQGGIAMVEAAGDPAAELLEWVAERVGPLAATRRDREAGALTLEVRHEQRPAALVIAPEVLEHFLAEEIVGALDEGAVPARLGEPGARLVCLEGSGRIVVQVAPMRG